MSEHTPGPWHVGSIGGLFDAEGNSIADLFDAYEADRRLIAAAPDLLAALERIWNYPYDQVTLEAIHHAMRQIVCAAIAKATGENP